MKLVFSTVKYVVGETDTLEKIAARSDCTPSQLMKLNKLNSRLLFTGQTIFVPDGTNAVADDNADELSTTSSTSTTDLSTAPSRASVSATTTETALVANVASSVDEIAHELDADCVQKFVKFTTVYITKRDGACPGVLIITPNCVMFDPDSNYPLVADNGQDTYGMVAPIDAVVSVGLYESTAKSSNADNGGPQRERTRTVSEQYWADKEGPDGLVGLPTVDVRTLSTKNGVDASTIAQRRSTGNDSVTLRRKALAAALNASGKEQQPRRSSVHMGALNTMNDADTKRRSSSPVSKLLSNIVKRASSGGSNNRRTIETAASSERLGTVDTWYNAEAPSSATVVDIAGVPVGVDKDELQKHRDNYEALNILKKKTDDLRKNLTYFYYYCLKPLDSSSDQRDKCMELPYVQDLDASSCYFLRIHLDERRRRKEITKNAGLYDFGDKSKNDFLFRVPFEKIDVLYLLFLQWSTEKSDPDTQSDSASGLGSQIGVSGLDTFDHIGFVFVDNSSHYRPATEIDFPASGNSLDELRSAPLKFCWEIVAVEELRRRMSLLEITEASFLTLPDGADGSTILNESMIRRVVSFLPARAQSYPWVLIYSSEQHGFSLGTMYRNMAKWRDQMSPTLLIIKDTNHHVFGAIVNCEFHMSDHFYGSGESLLFTVDPEFRVYRWTGANNFVVKGSQEGLAIGAGRGTFGLYLDADFFHGRTQPCDTFDNEPLTSSEDFTIAAVEAFGFSVTF